MAKKEFIPRQIPLLSDIPHLEYAQIFTASSIWYGTGRKDDWATFDLVVREMPGKRNFMLLGGVEEIIRNFLSWRYQPEYVDTLIARKIVSPAFGKYLKNFRFRGDVYAMPEGTAFFPGEPVVRITAPLIEANLFPVFLTTVISYPTLYLSKAIRVRLASPGKTIVISGGTRALGFENIIKAHRMSYLLSDSTAMPYIFTNILGLKKSLAPEITFYHALIKSFPDELMAFRTILENCDPHTDTTVMIDTYDYKQGIKNFIIAEREANKKGRSFGWIMLDSGNLLKISKFIKKELDRAGLPKIKIAAASNLDEEKILFLRRHHAPIDIYGVITELMNVSDRPVLEAVYKIASMVDKSGKVRHTAKLTPGKQSLPGVKQVFRRYGQNGKMISDAIGLENEKLGKKLLIPYIKGGKLVRKIPTLDEVKVHLEKEMKTLPEKLKSIDKLYPYPVKISPKLKKLFERVKREHLQ